MNKKKFLLVFLIGSKPYLLFAHFAAHLLSHQPGARENVVIYYPIPYSSGYFSLYREEPVKDKNIAVIAHGYFGT